jgi:hypothetical protein
VDADALGQFHHPGQTIAAAFRDDAGDAGRVGGPPAGARKSQVARRSAIWFGQCHAAFGACAPDMNSRWTQEDWKPNCQSGPVMSDRQMQVAAKGMMASEGFKILGHRRG